MHLKPPSVDHGVISFIWAFVLALLLWLFLLAVGMSKPTAFIVAAVAACAIFLYVRVYGEDEPRRVPLRRRRPASCRLKATRSASGGASTARPSSMTVGCRAQLRVAGCSAADVSQIASPGLRGPAVSKVNPKTSPTPNASTAEHRDARSWTGPSIAMLPDQESTCRWNQFASG